MLVKAARDGKAWPVGKDGIKKTTIEIRSHTFHAYNSSYDTLQLDARSAFYNAAT